MSILVDYQKKKGIITQLIEILKILRRIYSEVDEAFMFSDVDDISDEVSTRLDEIAGKWYSEISKLK